MKEATNSNSNEPFVMEDLYFKATETTVSATNAHTCIYPGIALMNGSSAAETALDTGVWITYSVKTLDPTSDPMVGLYKDGVRSKSVPTGFYFTAERISQIEEDWFPAKAEIILDIELAAELLEKRFRLAQEASMSLADIKRKLTEGIYEALDEFTSSTASIESQYWDEKAGVFTNLTNFLRYTPNMTEIKITATNLR
jgi:hypothetical protein